MQLFFFIRIPLSSPDPLLVHDSRELGRSALLHVLRQLTALGRGHATLSWAVLEGVPLDALGEVAGLGVAVLSLSSVVRWVGMGMRVGEVSLGQHLLEQLLSFVHLSDAGVDAGAQLVPPGAHGLQVVAEELHGGLLDHLAVLEGARLVEVALHDAVVASMVVTLVVVVMMGMGTRTTGGGADLQVIVLIVIVVIIFVLLIVFIFVFLLVLGVGLQVLLLLLLRVHLGALVQLTLREDRKVLAAVNRGLKNEKLASQSTLPRKTLS